MPAMFFKPFSLKASLFQIALKRTIQAEASLVWDIVTNTRRWPEWGPTVVAVVHKGTYIHASSSGWVKIPIGTWLFFRVTSFEPGQYWKWRVSGIPATGHRVKPLNPGQCVLTFEVPSLAAPYLTVCKTAADRIASLAENTPPLPDQS
jgi:hypothetical protein